MYGNRGQLARVLDKLLDNAQRHARRTMIVTVTDGARGVVLEVRGDGPGVPEAGRERVFTRFPPARCFAQPGRGRHRSRPGHRPGHRGEPRRPTRRCRGPGRPLHPPPPPRRTTGTSPGAAGA
ncbi:ATP-binding protein [Streptomyces xanthochromogenes]|uniref:ATP-binding protein n=1 Tax=Streptomyces xanthochromogenes TaxID=67384 RepID=UPI003F4D64F8